MAWSNPSCSRLLHWENLKRIPGILLVSWTVPQPLICLTMLMEWRPYWMGTLKNLSRPGIDAEISIWSFTYCVLVLFLLFWTWPFWDLELSTRVWVLYLLLFSCNAFVPVAVSYESHSIGLQGESSDWFLCNLETVIETDSSHFIHFSFSSIYPFINFMLFILLSIIFTFIVAIFYCFTYYLFINYFIVALIATFVLLWVIIALLLVSKLLFQFYLLPLYYYYHCYC